jgi:hypothetical protein
MPEMTAADSLEGFARAIHEIGAIAAVNVQIDKPRGKVFPAEVDGFIPFWAFPANCRDSSSLAGQKRPSEQCSGKNENSIRENRYRHSNASMWFFHFFITYSFRPSSFVLRPSEKQLSNPSMSLQ